MSYAAVAAHNAPPPSQQPHADPALLSTAPSEAPSTPDDTLKVNVVPTDFKENPETVTSEFSPDVSFPPINGGSSHPKPSKAKRHIEAAEEDGLYIWERVKEAFLRPAVAGGLIGIVNVGLLAGTSYALYTEPRFRRDPRILSSTVVATLALFSAEGYAAESFRKTPAGREEERKAKEKGSLVYRNSREHILRPGVLGGLVGLVNVGVLGTVSYFAYSNWDRPAWDRRVVSAVSVGLLALWGGEGALASRSDVQQQFHRKP
ncbi:hypothetical protein FA95DRAFT_243749 [Auriscalpium vulgare]|uniref:Uncharacterized protein n=1 Tax=Auriscalpium vulgare TaxID=40419 RepID=A0ACB8S5V2_9AGAM|nr:hypothetical protein FA95DRAFT_243749 [Auriscalpium vulgare]